LSVELEAGHDTDWLRPDRCPKGFNTDTVYFGRNETGLAEFEIAVGAWAGEGLPTRDDLNRLHAARLNRRAVPVLLAIELPGDRVVTFGPNVNSAPVGPLSSDQASRMLQAVLEEPDQVQAGTRWRSFTAAVDATSLPGVKNFGLFANHEIRTGVPQRDDWADACVRTFLPEHDTVDIIGVDRFPVNRRVPATDAVRGPSLVCPQWIL